MKKVFLIILLILLFSLIVFFSIKFLITLVSSLRGCGEEEIFIGKYFTASRLNDRDTLAALAVEPKLIEYKFFKIVSIDGPVTTEFKLPVLLKELEEGEKMVRTDGMEDAAILSRVKEIKRNINYEKKLIRLSTGIDRDLEMCTGKTYTYKITVEVKTADGKVKNYVFRLRKNHIKLQGKGRLGSLIITKIEAVD